MILTYQTLHHQDLSEELKIAKLVADFAIKNRVFSSSAVKHLGLKSVISNQVLRKYGRDKKARSIKSVNLIIPSQAIKLIEPGKCFIPSLRTELNFQPRQKYIKINQIELSASHAYITVTIEDNPIQPKNIFIGVDLNSTSHLAIVAKPDGKIEKLGKQAPHVHKKYKAIRTKLQNKREWRSLKTHKHRESNIIKNINHHISKKIVDVAIQQKSSIKLEDLKNIRKTAKQRRKQRYSLHSWSFAQLQSMIEYKAKLSGVEVVYIEPAYTSKTCSRCGELGNRQAKIFRCHCGYQDHADVNASFNIARLEVGRSLAERVVREGRTDTPSRKLVERTKA